MTRKEASNTILPELGFVTSRLRKRKPRKLPRKSPAVWWLLKWLWCWWNIPFVPTLTFIAIVCVGGPWVWDIAMSRIFVWPNLKPDAGVWMHWLKNEAASLPVE